MKLLPRGDGRHGKVPSPAWCSPESRMHPLLVWTQGVSSGFVKPGAGLTALTHHPYVVLAACVYRCYWVTWKEQGKHGWVTAGRLFSGAASGGDGLCALQLQREVSKLVTGWSPRYSCFLCCRDSLPGQARPLPPVFPFQCSSENNGSV